MAELLPVVLAAATVNNLVLGRLLGLGTLFDPPAGGNVLAETAATTLALVLALAAGHLLGAYVLVPLGLPYLRILAVLAVSAGAVQLANALFRRRPGSVATHLLVAGAALLAPTTTGSLPGAIATGLGAGAGYGLVLTLFASVLPRLARGPVPAPLRGPALVLMTAGLLSLALLGFAGVGA